MSKILLETDRPDTEGVMVLELGLTEAIDARQADGAAAALIACFGQPDGGQSRGHMNDGTDAPACDVTADRGLIVWILDPRDNPVFNRLYHETSAHIIESGIQSVTLQLRWDQRLPFLMCHLAIRFATTGGVAKDRVHVLLTAFSDALDEVPGRLSPSNVSPRTHAHWLVGVKTTRERMRDFRRALDANPSNSPNTDFRTLLREAAPVIDGFWGPLLVHQSVNHMVVHEADSTPVIETGGGVTAMLFSSGNLIHSVDKINPLPLWWRAPDVYSGWPEVNFMPCLAGAYYFSRFCGRWAREMDAELVQAATAIRALMAEPAAEKANARLDIRSKLDSIKAEISQIMIALGRNRRAFLQIRVANLQFGVRDHGLFTLLPASYKNTFDDWRGPESWVHGLSEQRSQCEDEAEALLAEHSRRVDEMSHLLRTDFDWDTAERMSFATDEMKRMTYEMNQATHAMKRWTVGGVVVGALAALAALATLAVTLLGR